MMKFPGGKIRFVVLILATGYLAACASTPPEAHRAAPVVREVVGSGTADDRAAIEKTDQQMFGAEHTGNPDPAANPNPQGQSLP